LRESVPVNALLTGDHVDESQTRKSAFANSGIYSNGKKSIRTARRAGM
jgi:hypothetical protein